MHLFKTGKLHRAAAAFLVFALCFTFESALLPKETRAEDNLLGDASWQFLFTAPMATVSGIIQSICVTDYYIITIENVADSADTLDIVSAYYKWPYDEYGSPVQQYSLARRVQSEEWEHGNSMCYNPNTDEIYVSLYTNTIAANRGCLYVMDPHTLTRTRTIKLSDEFNFLALAYDEVNNIYYAQTNAETGYSILAFDANFSIMANYGPEDPSPGYNFQDFCLAGDYLLEFPLTFGMNIGEYMMAYSVSSRSVVDTIPLNFGYDSSAKIEPESIKALDGSGFIVAVNATFSNGFSQCDFYRAEFPNLGLSASENGEQEAGLGETASAGHAVSEGQTAQNTVENSEANTQTNESVQGHEPAGNNHLTDSQAGQTGEEQVTAVDQAAVNNQNPSAVQETAGEQIGAVEQTVADLQPAADDQAAAGGQNITEEQVASDTLNTTEQTVTDERLEADAYGSGKEQSDEERRRSGAWMIVVLLIILLAMIIVFLYWQYVRRERLKREARMRKARRIMLSNMAKEAEKWD